MKNDIDHVEYPRLHEDVALQPIFCYNFCRARGEVPEWLNGAVSKTVVDPVSTVGSNPTLSAVRKVL